MRSMTSGSDEVIGAVAMAVKQRGRFLEGHAQWPDACQRINTLPKLMDWEPPSAHAAMALLASIGADDVQAAIEAESTASDRVHRMYLAVARAWVVREGTRALSSGPHPLGSLFSSSNRHRGAFPMATTSSSLSLQ